MHTNLFKIIETVLKTNKNYVSEDGKLLKAHIYSDAMVLNTQLLSLLLSNEEIKNCFFVKVNDILVFDKQKFVWLLESREFLPNSYTKYTNKIGLFANLNSNSRGGGIFK